MRNDLTFVLLALVCGLILPGRSAHADENDEIERAAQVEHQLLERITRADLKEVQGIAKTTDLRRLTNLYFSVLANPHADVVRWVRDRAGLSINDLQIAAIEGNVEAIDQALAGLDEKALKKSLRESSGPAFSSESALTLAVRNGRTEAVRKLIAVGANVNEWTRYTLTPLAVAAERGHIEVMKLLLDAGAKVNANPDGYTPLMRACCGKQPEAAKILLAAGADPNLQRHDGQRALHLAAKNDCAKCAELLLAHGADPAALAYKKDTALHYAELYKYEDVAEVLRAKANK
jgi:ankyrin repeat protein